MPAQLQLLSSREGQRLEPFRHCLIRPVTFESSSVSDLGSAAGGVGQGILLNISDGGMCILIDRQVRVQETLRIRVPTECSKTTAPTLAEVRWIKQGQLGHHDLHLVGLSFLL
jgi:hypothetical protein